MLENLRRLSASYLESSSLLPEASSLAKYLYGKSEGLNLAVEILQGDYEDTLEDLKPIYLLERNGMWVADHKPIHRNSAGTGISDTKEGAVYNLIMQNRTPLVQDNYVREPS